MFGDRQVFVLSIGSVFSPLDTLLGIPVSHVRGGTKRLVA